MFEDREPTISKSQSKQPLIPAIAYARVSTLSKDQKNSFENQQQIFIEQAEKLGYYLVKECGKDGIYADRGISGKSLKKRDMFNKMMIDSKKGLFKQILTTNIARYSRDIVALQDTVRDLRREDIGVFFLKENINTADYAKSYGDEVMLNILGSLAQNDLVQLSKGIQGGMRQAQRNGIWTSQPPYGYDRINGLLKINESEAETVKKIYSWYVNEGLSFYKISSILNSPDNFIPSKMGRKWQESSIRKMIDNPIYIGTQINYQTMMLDIFTDKIQVIENSDRIIHQFEHLKIIDDETFEKAILQKNQRKNLKENNTRYSTANFLSNLFKCGNCGGTMKRTNKDNNFYYICSHRGRGIYHCEHYNYIREEEIIAYLVKIISEKEILDRDILKDYYDWYIETNLGGDFIKQLPELLVKIEKLQKRKNGLIIMKADGEINKDDFTIASKEIEEELKSLLLIKKRIDNINEEIKIVYATFDIFVNALENFSPDNLSNQLLRRIFKKVTITTSDDKEKIINEVWNTGLDKTFEEITDEWRFKNKQKADI